MEIAWMKTNCPHSLISPGRRQTFVPRYVNVCFGWRSPLLVEEIKKLLFREQTLCLLLFLIPQPAVPKQSNPPHTGLLFTLLSKYTVGEECHFICLLQYYIYLWWCFQWRIQVLKGQGCFWAKWWNKQTGLQSKDLLYSGTLFIKQVMYEKQHIEKSCLQKLTVDKRIWCVCSWSIATFISDFIKKC